MAEKRKADRTICVKIGAKVRFKIELFPAAQWAESAQLPGERFRLRINRRWHDEPDGGILFLDMIQVSALVGMIAGGEKLALPSPPELPTGTRVSVPNGKVLAGQPLYEGSRTHTAPMRGHDGRFYVNVTTFTTGSIMIAVDDLIIHRGK